MDWERGRKKLKEKKLPGANGKTACACERRKIGGMLAYLLSLRKPFLYLSSLLEGMYIYRIDIVLLSTLIHKV